MKKMAVNRLAITINSRRYTVVANESEEYIERLAEHINEKVDYVLKGGQNIIGERPIVLAALNICDEYFKTDEAGRLMKDRLQTCSDKLVAANERCKALEKENKALKERVDDAESGQVTMDETAARAEKAYARNKLNEANSQIKFLEGQIKLLENKIKEMQERETEILAMIDGDTK